MKKLIYFMLIFAVFLYTACKDEVKNTEILVVTQSVSDEVLFETPDVQAFDDNLTKSGDCGYRSSYNGYFIAKKNQKRVIGVGRLGVGGFVDGIPTTMGFSLISLKSTTNTEIDNDGSVTMPLKVGIHKIEGSSFSDRDECTSRSWYIQDSSKVSLVKVISIEKEPKTGKIQVRGRFKVYYILVNQKEGESFPATMSFEDGAFFMTAINK
jgi:hypothetical protein